MFGPAMFPLLMAGSTFPPSLLADWKQYGITLEEVAGTSSVPGSLQLLPCLQYKVRSQVEGEGICDQVLQVFVLLEHVERDSGAERPVHWTRCIKMANTMRKNVRSLSSVYSESFHRAVHSALNKLLYNYVSRDEVCDRGTYGACGNHMMRYVHEGYQWCSVWVCPPVCVPLLWYLSPTLCPLCDGVAVG